jgi:hypothetical protein
MASNHRASFRVRQWSTGAGVAAAAAMIGMSTAHADTDAGDVFPVNTDLGQADQVLTYDQPILSSSTVPPQFETALSEQTAILNNALTTLNHAEALQGPAGAAQELYSGADELFRTASVAFEPASATFAELPSTSTEYNLLLPDLQLIGATYDLSFVDSLSQVFGLGGPVATGAAADSAATLATAVTGTPDDVVGQTLAAASSNQYDPAVFDYSADPSNLFSPVYSIQPVGPEDVTVTDASGDVFGTQDFSVSSFGIPVDTFTGNVEYSPVSSPLDLFGNPYIEDINVAGEPGTLLPENTSFLVSEFGSGYGNVLAESMNSAGTDVTVGDFILTPFGDENITPIVEFLLNYTGTPLADAAGAVDPWAFTDLLSSIGL